MQQVDASNCLCPVAKKRNHSFTNKPVPDVKNTTEEKNLVMLSLKRN
jgi:hypothetical protein